MIYIMRHGTTDWNLKYKLQGRIDIPLNETGREMAREARKRYQHLPFDVCYCSPLQRARETAEIFIEGRNIPLKIDERLREMSFGICEGTENVYQDSTCPVYPLFFDSANYIPPEGAESLQELYARTGEFIQEVLKPHERRGEHVLVVGHGAMNCSIINQYRNVPIEKFWTNGYGNCELIPLTQSDC